MPKRGLTWREDCAPLIAQVIRENEGKPLPEIKAALRDAYPYGQRSLHPYKIWRDEIKRQLGQKKSKSGTVNDNQLNLFN
jgi:hypothetical protein